MVEVELGEHVRKEMSVLFSDIRGFTPIVERLQPQQHIDFINTYLSYMEPSIVNNRGFVDSYIGDAIMALFDGDADTAVKAGIDMSVSLQRLNVVRARQEQPPVRMGIGVNTGMLTLGTIGGSARIKCGVIGDPVNLAARVESLSKTYGAFLLITHHTHGRLRDPARYALRIVDRVTVKGKTEPVTLYEVLDAEGPELKGPKLELLPVYNEAVALYFRAEFAAASRLFGECVSRCPGDVAARGLMSRCLKYLEAGVPAGWDGVVTLDHK
jgi:class 3 adenylate cyclase